MHEIKILHLWRKPNQHTHTHQKTQRCSGLFDRPLTQAVCSCLEGLSRQVGSIGMAFGDGNRPHPDGGILHPRLCCVGGKPSLEWNKGPFGVAELGGFVGDL